MTTSAIILPIIHILNILALITVIFFQRKESSARFAWILVLALIPVFGFILYLFFGHDFRRKERLHYSEEASKEIHDYVQQQLDDAKKMDFLDTRFIQLARMNLRNDHSPLTNDNTVQIFTNGRDTFACLLQDLNQAQHYIHLLYFIFRTDELGNAILDILVQKAEAGLDVRVVYDGMGNLAVSSKAFKRLKKAGGKVYRYSPLLTGLVSANYRNHRKLAIIDGKLAYIGGMNIGSEYIHGRKKLTPWRDTHLRIEGSAAKVAEAIFLPDYVYAANQKGIIEDSKQFFEGAHDSHNTVTVQMISSEPHMGGYHIHNAYTKMISSAETYIYIHTPYLVPDRTLLDSLHIALASGVDVRIMIPLHPDKSYVWVASLDYARYLHRLGAKIYLYKGFIHSKMLVTDDQALSIGSANIDARSMFLSYEANALIFNEELAASQREQFYLDMENSLEADDAYFKAIALPVRVLMPVIRLFSPLL